MTQSQHKPITFDDFIAWYPENSEHRYELHNGVIIEIPKPRGKHSEIAGFLSLELGLQCRSSQLSCFIPKESVVKPFRDFAGYEPDVIVLDRHSVSKEPRWETESIITMGESVSLIVEVVSTNWRDDYFFLEIMKKWGTLNTGLLTTCHWVAGGLLATPSNRRFLSINL